MQNAFLIIVIVLFSVLSSNAQDVPFRDENTYKLELGMEYKTKPEGDNNTFKPGEAGVIKNNEPQFYLTLKLDIQKLLPEDFKLKIVNNSSQGKVKSKRLKEPEMISLNLGAAEDMKKGKSPNAYTIFFLDKNKVKRTKITILIKENGDFMVNGAVFGKI